MPSAAIIKRHGYMLVATEYVPYSPKHTRMTITEWSIMRGAHVLGKVERLTPRIYKASWIGDITPPTVATTRNAAFDQLIARLKAEE